MNFIPSCVNQYIFMITLLLLLAIQKRSFFQALSTVLSMLEKKKHYFRFSSPVNGLQALLCFYAKQNPDFNWEAEKHSSSLTIPSHQTEFTGSYIWMVDIRKEKFLLVAYPVHICHQICTPGNRSYAKLVLFWKRI